MSLATLLSNKPSTAPTTTNDLYAKWLLGDGDRTEILLRLRSLLIQHATRVCWNILHQDNEHLVIEMVDDLLMELDKFNGKSQFSTYAHARFRYRCIDEFRFQIRNIGESLTAVTETRNEDGYREEAVSWVGGRAVQVIPVVDEYLCVSEILDELPVRDREIVQSRLEGHTFKEISSASGVPVTTVKRVWKEVLGGVYGSA